MLERMVVWHVEDDAVQTETLVRLISKIPGVAALSFDSYSAVERHLAMNPNLPDLVILDMNLGAGLPGSEAGRMIRNACSGNPPEFIFHSAYQEAEYLEAGIHLGAATYVRKSSKDIEYLLYVIRVLLFRRALNRFGRDARYLRQCLVKAGTLGELHLALVSDVVLGCCVQFFGEGINLWVEGADTAKWLGAESVSGHWYEPSLLQTLKSLGETQAVMGERLQQWPEGAEVAASDWVVKLYQARGLDIALRASTQRMGASKAANLAWALGQFLPPVWIDRLMLTGAMLFAEERRRRDRIGDTARICAAIARMQSNLCQAAIQHKELLPHSHASKRMGQLHQGLSALAEQLNVLEHPTEVGVTIPLAALVDDIWDSLVTRFKFYRNFLACRIDHQVKGNSSDLRAVFRRLLTMFANWADESGQEPGLELTTLREGEWVVLDLVDQSPRRGRLFLESIFQPFGQVPSLDDDLEAWMGPSLAVLILEERLGGRVEQLSERLMKSEGHWLRLWLPAADIGESV